MKKWFIGVLLVVLLGGLGFFGYKTWIDPTDNEKSAESKGTVTETKKVKKEEEAPVYQKIETNKVWEFSFDDSLNAASVNKKNVYITNEKGKHVKNTVSLTNENKTIQIRPPAGGYKKGGMYELHIKNGGITYQNGKPVSKPYVMTFVIQRDKVEKVELSDALIPVKQNQIEEMNDAELVLSKSVKRDLKVGDILIVPSKDNKVGNALKVSALKERGSTYEVETVKPEFRELFDKLDIYNDYQIKPENVTLAKGLEGVTMNDIAVSNPKTMIANSSSPTHNGEYAMPELPSVGASYSDESGLEFTLQNLKIGNVGEGLYVDGRLRLLNPEISLDNDIVLSKVKRMMYKQNVHAETNVTVRTVMGEKKTEKKNPLQSLEAINNAIEEEVVDKKLKLAEFAIPIPSAPVLQIKGTISLQLTAGIRGEQKATITYEVDDTKGLLYENKQTKPISHSKKDVDFRYSPLNSTAEAQFGPNMQGGLFALNVFGAGVETFIGLKAEAAGAIGLDVEKGMYHCYKASFGPYTKTSLFVDVEDDFNPKNAPQRIVELKLGESDFDLNKEFFNTCDAFDSLNSHTKKIKLHSGKTKDVTILGKYLDIISAQYGNKEMEDHAKLKVTFSNPNVVKVKKNKNDKKLTLTALKIPESGETTMTVAYSEKVKAFGKKVTSKVEIPILISDYVTEKPDKKLNGQWSRNNKGAIGNLAISDATNKAFSFALHVESGAHAGDIEGKAIRKGNVATYRDTEYDEQCVLTFTLKKKTVKIEETPQCVGMHGLSSSFDGTYDKGTLQVQENTLAASDIVSANVDEDLQQLLGPDYPTLVETTQQVLEGTDEDDLGATVITGAIPGLYTQKESIIMIDEQYYYVAFIVDDSKVRFYTNNPTYKSGVPYTIVHWMSGFSTYPIERVYKEM